MESNDSYKERFFCGLWTISIVFYPNLFLWNHIFTHKKTHTLLWYPRQTSPTNKKNFLFFFVDVISVFTNGDKQTNLLKPSVKIKAVMVWDQIKKKKIQKKKCLRENKTKGSTELRFRCPYNAAVVSPIVH